MEIGQFVEKPDVEILEQWTVLDRWWLPEDEQDRREYADVKWLGRRLVFMRTAPDNVWRILHAERTL